MKQLSSVILVLAIAAAGCEKSQDLTPLAEEAQGVVETYRPQIDQLGRRAEDLVQRGMALKLDGADALPASNLLGDARVKLNELKVAMNEAPNRIAAARQAGKVPEMTGYLHRLRDQLGEGQISIRASLDAVEGWLGRVEDRPKLQQETPAAGGAAGGTQPAGEGAVDGANGKVGGDAVAPADKQ
jgi:hypothetical protein